MKELAIQKINNKEVSTATIMCAFDIVGNEFLGGEMSYINHFDGISDLICDFELEANEIIEYMLENPNYNTHDLFVTFDGETLCSFEDIDYFVDTIIDKMNGECAEFILSNS